MSLVAFVWNEKSFLLFCHLDFVVLNLELEKKNSAKDGARTLDLDG